ncbi:hypothetical protein KAW64_13695 [bacterium]|nr:hypothetical protein [bacterium]
MNRATLRTVALCAAVLCLLCSTAPAQIPQRMNYQVMLTDDSDQPLANESVQLVFRIYNVDAGGASLWTETHNVTTNSIGVVSIVLGSTNPLAISFEAPLWLQVTVDGEIMSPRRELTSAPYALSVSGAGDGHSLDADDGSPVDALYVDSEGNVGIGTTSPDRRLHVEDGLRVAGSAQTVTFDMSVSGDDAVMLPESSIASAEVKDEPGVASHTNPGGTYLTGTYQNLALECLHAPADGYVLIIGTCKVHVVHDGMATTKATIGISDSSFTLPTNQQLGVTVSGSLNAGTYDQTVTVHGLFTVNGGQTKCAYLVGRQDSGTYMISVSEYQLTLLFVPTAYGAIDPTSGPGEGQVEFGDE